MSKIDEAFERHCTREGITSEQWKGDIKPHFEAGYRSGAASKQVETYNCTQCGEKLVDTNTKAPD